MFLFISIYLVLWLYSFRMSFLFTFFHYYDKVYFIFVYIPYATSKTDQCNSTQPNELVKHLVEKLDW